MTEETKKDDAGKKPRKDPAININQVEFLGRVVKEPTVSPDGKFVRVPIVVPAWSKDGTQWVPFFIDVVGDYRDKVKPAKPGYFFRCTCFLAERELEDDNKDKKYVKVLQIDPYREVGLMEAAAPENPLNPPNDGLCYSRVLLAGRNFIRKKQMDEGKGDTPILREGQGGVYAFVNLRYEDPYQQVPEGEWPKNIFFDISVNGDVAKRVNEFCHNRAQVVVRGELVKEDCDFQISGKTPKQPKVRLIPGGLSFVNIGGGAKSEPKSPEAYDAKDVRGVEGLDDDIAF